MVRCAATLCMKLGETAREAVHDVEMKVFMVATCTEGKCLHVLDCPAQSLAELPAERCGDEGGVSVHQCETEGETGGGIQNADDRGTRRMERNRNGGGTTKDSVTGLTARVLVMFA